MSHKSLVDQLCFVTLRNDIALQSSTDASALKRITMTKAPPWARSPAAHCCATMSQQQFVLLALPAAPTTPTAPAATTKILFAAAHHLLLTTGAGNPGEDQAARPRHLQKRRHSVPGASCAAREWGCSCFCFCWQEVQTHVPPDSFGTAGGVYSAQIISHLELCVTITQ